MLVDPNTGMPMQMGPQAESLSGTTAQMMGMSQGMAPGGTAWNMLNHIPTLKETMAWNAWRGSNTILAGGGFHEGRSGGILKNHLHPRAFTRMHSSSALTGSTGSAGSLRGMGYSPFQLSRLGNAGMSWAIRTGRIGLAGQDMMKGRGMLNASMLSDIGHDGRKGHANFFQTGMYSRMSAASRIQGMSGRRWGKRRAATWDFIKNTDEELYKAMGFGERYVDKTATSQALMMSKSTISSQMGGYMAGVMNPIDDAVHMAAYGTGRTSFLRGAASATSHLALGGVDATVKGFRIGGLSGYARGIGTAARAGGSGAAARFAGAGAARAVGLAIPGLNIALTAMMVADLTKMGMAAVGGAANLGKDAFKSFKGSIDKPVMGMGFKDNTVAATSRQRGVMAIANSQLNARSVLGSEAGAMHARFG